MGWGGVEWDGMGWDRLLDSKEGHPYAKWEFQMTERRKRSDKSVISLTTADHDCDISVVKILSQTMKLLALLVSSVLALAKVY